VVHRKLSFKHILDAKKLQPGHQLQLLRAGAEAFPAMLQAIVEAQRTIFFEMYIFRSDWVGQQFADALKRAAQAGVEVRLLLDSVGSLELEAAFITDLRNAGVQVLEYRPIAPWRYRWGVTQRNHRKVLVVDQRVAFVGGLNIGQEYAPTHQGGGGWYDLAVRIEGPAVDTLSELVQQTWERTGNASLRRKAAPLRTPPPPDEHSAMARVIASSEQRRRFSIHRAHIHALGAATQSIVLVQAYFVPGAGLLHALRRAARRGVEVSVLLPSTYDVPPVRFATHAIFGRLLRAGVRIYEWPGPMMHAKAAVVDGEWAAVGSYNFDYRSLFYNLEVVLVSVDRKFAQDLQHAIFAEIDRSQRVTLENWRQRPLQQRWMERLVYPFRRWL